MRLRRLIIRFITALAQGFVWLAALFRRLAEGLEPSAASGAELETAETEEFVSAEHQPPEDWLAHVRRGPPSDWLEKVRQGAPHLLDPQTRPSRPPGPPPPRRQAAGHRPPSAANRVRPQPLKQVRNQPTRPTPGPANVPITAAPLADASPTTDTAEAADEGPPLPGEGEILQPAFPEMDNQSAPERPIDWPTSGEPWGTQTADPLPLPSVPTEPPDPLAKALSAEPHPFITTNKTASRLDSLQEIPVRDKAALARPEEQQLPSLKSSASFTALLHWLVAQPRTWVNRLMTGPTLPGRDVVLSESDRQQESQRHNVFEEIERPSDNPFNSRLEHRPTVSSPGFSLSPKARQAEAADSLINTQQDFWPPLADTAVPDKLSPVFPIDFPTRPQIFTAVNDHTQSSWHSAVSQPITAAFWPTLPDTFLDETAENEEEELDYLEHRLRLDHEQRGPEWNE